MAGTPEGKVKTKFKTWVKKHLPEAWYFLPVSRGYGTHGIPDFVMCIPKKITQDMVGKTIGVFVGVETKAPGGKASAHQDARAIEILQAWGRWYLVRGTGGEFDEQVAEIERDFGE